MKFIQITEDNLPVLKELFGFKDFPKCLACGKQTTKDELGILPTTKKGKFSKGQGELKAIFLCESPLCLCEYLNERESSQRHKSVEKAE